MEFGVEEFVFLGFRFELVADGVGALGMELDLVRRVDQLGEGVLGTVVECHWEEEEALGFGRGSLAHRGVASHKIISVSMKII